jgi:hypothetical protein
MASRYPPAFQPASGSFVANLLRRATPHPHTFVCGIRWPDDAAHGAGGRWRYRRAWVDPWHEGDSLRVRLGDTEVIHIRMEPDPWWNGGGPAARPGLVILAARSTDSDARVLLAVPHGFLCEFDVDAL